MFWFVITLFWTLTGAATWGAYHHHQRKARGELPECPTHGRNCPGHVHVEVIGDVMFAHWPDGTTTAAKAPH